MMHIEKYDAGFLSLSKLNLISVALYVTGIFCLMDGIGDKEIKNL